MKPYIRKNFRELITDINPDVRDSINRPKIFIDVIDVSHVILPKTGETINFYVYKEYIPTIEHKGCITYDEKISILDSDNFSKLFKKFEEIFEFQWICIDKHGLIRKYTNEFYTEKEGELLDRGDLS